jgi:3-oxoacyl-[acyl-carrier-protein] synthase II
MSLKSKSAQDIVITGVGIVSPVGIGLSALTENLRAGATGISKSKFFPGFASPDAVTAEIGDFNEETAKKIYLKEVRRSIKLMCRDIQLGVASALMALEDSKLNMESIDHTRMGVEFGANLMLSEPAVLGGPAVAMSEITGDASFKGWGEAGYSKMEPLWLLRYLPNMPACHISIASDARGPSNSLTLDEASGNVVIGEAVRILQRGAADIMITGATGSYSHPVRTLHLALVKTLLASSPAEPARRSRPFEKDRSGFVVGEGAGTLILETRAHAEARGATIYGRVLSTGAATCVNPDGQPRYQDAVKGALKAALRSAEMEPTDIGHYNAHAAGLPEADAAEARAINEVFGSYRVPVTAPKSYVGNSSAGSGLVELMTSLAGVKAGFIPRTLNYETPDPACDVSIVTESGVSPALKTFVSMNVTRKGQAAAVIIEVE